MSEVITRWDWICLGILIGFTTSLIAQAIQRWIDARLVTSELQLQHALASDLVKMKAKLEQQTRPYE